MPAVVVAEVVCACPNKLGAVVVVDVVRVFVDGVNENEAGIDKYFETLITGYI